MLVVDRFLYDLVAAVAADQGVPRELALAVVMHESGGNPDSTGDAGHSIGLMQLHDQGAGAGMSVEKRRNAYRNITRGIEHLSSLYNPLRGWRGALMCYNMGEAGWANAGCPQDTGYSVAVMALWSRIIAAGVVTAWGDGPVMKWQE